MAIRKTQHFSDASTGFTLIEFLLAVALFSLIVGPATAVFISALRNNSALAGTQNMMDSTRYALEYMSRQIRLPQRFDGSIPCANMSIGETYHANASGTDLTFINSNGHCVYFYLSANKIEATIDASAPLDLTFTSAVFIPAGGLRFIIHGASSTDSLQPIATIELDAQGVSNGQAQGSISHIETSASSRFVDVP